MSHFGVLSYKGTGHLNPLIALSRQLTLRGHRVTLFQEPELEAQVRRHGLEFFPIAKATPSAGQRGSRGERNSSMSVKEDLRYRIERIVDDIEMSLRQLPDAITKAGIDVLIIDEIIASGPTVAQMLSLPYCVVSAALPHRLGWSVSRQLTGDGGPRSRGVRQTNGILEVSAFCMGGPVRRKVDALRRKLKLGPIAKIQQECPPFAHIAQLPQCLDLPRSILPGNFHYTGPFVDETARPSVDFPWNRLDGRPLIYASLGTAREVQQAIFHLIVEACYGLNLQLVISLGGRSAPDMFYALPGSPIVVRNAPQLELLKKAELVVTHGGLNTVLETLMQGKPLIAIPLAYDQPAVASRLARLRVARVLAVESLSSKEIRMALTNILNDPSYRMAALKLQGRIRSARGLERAADLIEAALAPEPATD